MCHRAALAFGGGPQAYARPYDVLIRGMATEAQGVWAERAWLFISLCRQLEIDAGLITYTRSTSLETPVPRYGLPVETEAALYGLRRGPKPPIVWICAALVDDKAYLFDARLGHGDSRAAAERAWRRSTTPWPTRRFSSG